MNKFFFLLILFPLFSFAEERKEEPKTLLALQKQVAQTDKLKEGWTKKMSISAILGLNTSDNVVGQADGNSEKYEGKVEASFYHRAGINEFRQDVTYSGATTKTPTIPKYVKSADEFKYKAIYLKGFKKHPNLGPYAMAMVTMPFFKGLDVREEEKTYYNSTTSTTLGLKSEQHLTDAFKPLTLKQSVGLFAKVIERKNTYLELRVGLGAQQIYADNQLILKDDEATKDTIELQQLEDSDQVGVEYGLTFKGSWNKESSYNVAMSFLTPVGKEIEAGKECADCDELELTNVDLSLSFATQLNSWSKLSYEYKAVKQPETLNEFQIQNGLILTIFYNIL